MDPTRKYAVLLPEGRFDSNEEGTIFHSDLDSALDNAQPEDTIVEVCIVSPTRRRWHVIGLKRDLALPE